MSGTGFFLSILFFIINFMSEFVLPISTSLQSPETASSPDAMLDALSAAYDASHCNTKAYRSDGITRRNTSRPRVTKSDSCKIDGRRLNSYLRIDYNRHTLSFSQKIKSVLSTYFL